MAQLNFNEDVIRAIDEHIAKLTQARALLMPSPITPSSGSKHAPAKRKSTLSAAGRLSIQRAQRARWAKKKREARKAA